MQRALSSGAQRNIEELAMLFEDRGPPGYIRSDNGPEFVADAVQAFLRFREAHTPYIAPGSPWENGYIESFNSVFRDELLDRELFANLLEAQVITVEYRKKEVQRISAAWRATGRTINPNQADPSTRIEAGTKNGVKPRSAH